MKFTSLAFSFFLFIGSNTNDALALDVSSDTLIQQNPITTYHHSRRLEGNATEAVVEEEESNAYESAYGYEDAEEEAVEEAEEAAEEEDSNAYGSAYGYEDAEEAAEEEETEEEAAEEEDSNAYGSTYGYEDAEEEAVEEEESNAYESAYGYEDAEEEAAEEEESNAYESAYGYEDAEEAAEEAAEEEDSSAYESAYGINVSASNIASFASGIVASVGAVAAVSQVKRRYATKKDLRAKLNPSEEAEAAEAETAYALA